MIEIKRNLSPVFVSLLSTILLSSAAQAELTAPTFTKSFSPDEIGPGSVSTLTFVIDNTGGGPVDALAFTDTLPSGMTLAAPAFVSSNCGGSLTAPDGGSAIELSGGLLGTNETCEIVVNVTAGCGEGDYLNTSGDLTGNDVNTSTPFEVSGAGASLGVSCVLPPVLPGFAKSFAPSTIEFGERSTLTFTIDNSVNGLPVSNLDFTDNLPPGMLVADPADASTTCGTAVIPATVTAIPGSAVIVLDSDGTAGFPAVAAGATCTVAVDVIGGTIGELGNVTNNLLANFVPAGKAAAVLEVTGAGDRLRLTKAFTNDPVPPGGEVTLEFTVTNLDRDFVATGIAFADDLEDTLSDLAPVGPLPTNPCGPGSSLTFDAGELTLSGGTLAPDDACTIPVSLLVPGGSAPGAYTNYTSAVTGDIDGSPETGNAGSDLLFVSPIPVLTKEFLEAGTLDPDPVVNTGDDVVLRFTVTNTSTSSGATDVAFDDELTDGSGGFPPDTTSGFLPFPLTIVAPTLPTTACGGTLGFYFPATDRQGLRLTGGTIAPGATCSFDVTLTIPDSLAPGIYTNTTEAPSATVGGATRTGRPASDTLEVIAAPQLSKVFTDDPVAPGGSVTLEFTLSHSPNASGDATAITFTDNLAPVLAGLTASGLPLTEACDPDGPGGNPGTGTLSGSAGDTLLTFMNGTLSPGESCTFSVTLDVPAGAAADSYTNTTSGVGATVGGLATTSAPAEDDLTIASLTFTKEFLKNPVIPGDTTTLRFTIDNVDPAQDATITFFTDNLAAELPGLAATGPASVNTCGGTLAGTTFLIYTGGSVTAGTSCEIEVEVLVPLGADDGDYLNVTSSLSATQGVPVSIAPAVDVLTVDSVFLAMSKSFVGDPVLPGGTLDLVFTATNLSSDKTVTDIAFSDDLEETLSGLMATGASFNTCGGMIVEPFPTGSVTYADGTLLPGTSCTVQIAVLVPPGPLPGSVFPNTTSPITGLVDGTINVSGNAASDDLDIQNATFSKIFINGPVVPGRKLPLRFTMQNFSDTPLSGLAFFDNLDEVLPGVPELTATGLPANPVCGTGTVAFTSPLLTVTGASLGAAGNLDDTCSFDVIVEVPTVAEVCKSYVNITSPLSQQGAGGALAVADPATALLFVLDPLSGSYVQSDGLVSIEAEKFLGNSTTGDTGPWEVLLDMFDPNNVSNRAAIKASAGNESPSGAGAMVSYDVQLEAATQDVWVRVRTISDQANSIFFQFDSEPVQTVDLGGPHNTWRWVKLPLSLLVAPPDGDTHTVKIIRREGMTEVDKLVLTRNVGYQPDGLGPDESTRLSVCTDTDGDGDPDVTDPDDDNDGIPDVSEIANGQDPLNPDDANEDPDNDGLTNLEEFEQGLDPNSPDSDGDGIGDALDEEPLAPSNFCTDGDSDNGIMEEEVTTELTCAARVSIDVISPPTVVTGTGHLTLISPLVTFENGFTAGWLTVISADPCPSCINSVAPKVIDTDPADSATDVPVGSNIEITFSEPVEVTGSWFDISCTVGGTSLAATVTDNDPVFTLDPDVDFFPGETCYVTVYALGVTDEAIDPPLNMEADFEFSFTTVPPMDFGDAPDPLVATAGKYPTLAGNDGARHVLDGTLFLGTLIDSEADGQPNATATGDDIAGAADEDGVTFSTLTVSTTGTATVTASAPGLLDAWVDFNADGDWLDLGEQIAASLSVGAGPNAVPVAVPAGAMLGDTFARFRLSTAGGLAPSGAAADGEVEDYAVTIVDNSVPTDIALDNSDVNEIQPAGTAVGNLTTTDADAGDSHTYSLVAGAGDTDNASFTIDGNQLKTAAVFDFETQNTFNVRVQTDDGNGGTFEEAFTITVNDVNEAPTDIALDSSSVNENQPVGTAVGSLTTTDPDTADTHTYTLVAGIGDTDNAQFTIVGSQLQTAAVLNFEAADHCVTSSSTCSIRVQTDDGNGGTFQEAFIISIGDINDAPVAVGDGYSGIGNTRLTLVAALSPSTPVPVTVELVGNVTDNDTDEDGDTIGVVANAAIATTQGGSVNMAADGRFIYSPPAGVTGGDDTFMYTPTDSQGAGTAGTVTITLSDMVWYVDDRLPNIPGTGTSDDPFRELSSAGVPSSPGDIIFVYEGTYNSGITLKDNQQLIGQGVDLVVNSTTLVDAGTRPTIANAGGAAAILAESNTVRGLDINGSSQGIVGSGFGIWTANNLVIDTTGGAAIDLFNGTVDLTIDSLSSVGAGISFDTVSGNVVVTNNTDINSGANTGIDIMNSGTATFTFNDLDVTTTTGDGLTANGGTINSTSGDIRTGSGISVDISDTALAMTLTSVTSSFAASGIRLMDTTGSFTVKGDGSALRNGSGGSIAYSSGNGISLTNVTDVSLSNIEIDNSGDNGIKGSNVTGFELKHAWVTDNGDAVNEGGLRFDDNLLGMATIDNSEISGSAEHNIEIINTSGTLTMLTVSDSNITTNGATFGADGLLVETRNDANATVIVSNTTFDDNRSDGIQMSAFDSSSLDFTVTGSTFESTPDASPEGSVGARGLNLSSGSNAALTFDVTGSNTFDTFSPGIGEEAINLGLSSTSTSVGSAVGKINGNTFSNTGGAIGIDNRGRGTMTIEIGTNTATSGISRQVIDIITGDAPFDDPKLNLTMLNNSLGPPTLTVDVVAIEFLKDSEACMNIRGNTATRSGAADGFDILDDTNTGPPNPAIRLEAGSTDCGGACADALAQIEATNTINPFDDNAVDDMTLVPPGTCPTPP